MMRLFGLVMVSIFLAGCATPIETSSTSRPGTDFSVYKTYSWVPGTGRSSVIEAAPYLGPQIRSAVEARLNAAGLTKVAEGTGDLGITFTVLVKEAYATQTFQNVGGSTVGAYQYDNFSIEPLNATTETTIYEKGTLAVNLADRSTGDMVWRGRAKAKIFEDAPRGPEVARSRVDLAVVRMFAGFPPPVE